ncbi:MAG: CehA/McbA family metallohydrolase [Anaerolineae bacterium]|nr:CehA/McbA family metallohydrolase [Anaerolineae bacterium]
MQLHIEGTLTTQDNHRHISHNFVVPEGATKLDIDFEYAPNRTEKYGNLLTLSLFDPQTERGTGHRGQPKQHIMVSTAEASPGYLLGSLPAGTWDIMINSNLINDGPPVNYQFDIAIGFETQTEAKIWSRGTTLPRGEGWYRGDLHGHTIHSDGSWDVEGLVGFARQHQLDFVTLTDHNTISALPQMDSLSADGLLTMGGFELTTFYGHALALGIRQILDWRVRPNERTIAQIKGEIEALGGLFVIAHPMAPGDPVCTGCQWGYDDMMPGTAGVVEVWNEHWDSTSNNEESLQLWYGWLNQGHRLYATVGTDIHGTPDSTLEFGFNNVFAEALSEVAILKAIRQGHNYLSSGPKLAFSGTSTVGKTVMMGDHHDGQEKLVTVSWEACNVDDRVRLIVDRQVKEELVAETKGEHSWKVDEAHWCLVEVRDLKGNLRAVTNPIFIE